MRRYGRESILSWIRYRLGIAPKLNITLETKEIKVEPRKIKCKWSQESLLIIQTMRPVPHIIVHGKSVRL